MGAGSVRGFDSPPGPKLTVAVFVWRNALVAGEHPAAKPDQSVLGDHGPDADVGEDLQEQRMRNPPIDHGGPRQAALDSPQAGLHFRHHACFQIGHQLAELGCRQLGDHLAAVRPVAVETFHVGQHDQPLRFERYGQRGGRGIGIDVVHNAVGVGCDAGDHRHAA